MPVECTIDKERRLVMGSAWGAITSAEVKRYQDQLLADSDFNPEFDQLMDGTGITDWLLTIEEAEAATRRRFFSPTSKRAYIRPVPTSAPLARILNAYCEMTKDASHIRVFDDIPSALQWLGLEALPEIRSAARRRVGRISGG
ncbi:MAG TPA: hypothetical protein VJX69_15635 [Terriglobales bacterium]|nr:hypothetical protein [Terriglobales bacterium]